jgi:hypothetical protein
MSCYLYWDQYAPEVYRQFNEQIGRLAVILRGAKNASNVALYYPIESFQATFRPTPGCLMPVTIKSKPADYDPQLALMEETQEQIIPNLFENGYDFSWLDGDAVLKAEIREGRLIVGAHEYTSIIMPRVELLPLAVMQKLGQFEQSGGKVLWVDSLPRLGDAPAQVAENLGPAFPADFRLRLDAENKNIFVNRWERDGRRINYVVNNSAESLSPALRLEGETSGSVQIYNPEDGSITPLALPGAVTLKPFSSVFLIEEG